jgi:serine/threonine protein kinase
MSGKLKLSESEMNRPSEIESVYKIYKKLNDPSYGDITLMQHPSTRDKIAMKEKVLNTEDQFTQEIAAARNRKKLKNDYILELKDYSTRKKNDFCSTFYVLRAFYDYEPNHLKKEILDRKNKGENFSMEELTHLLYNTVEAGAYLQENGQNHADIRPSQILVTKNGTFKLGDRLNDPTPPPRNQFNNIVAGKDLYMSPILFNALKQHKFNIPHNAYKSDVFSLGMTIMEAGLMRPMTGVYPDNKSIEISEHDLQENLNEFSQKYQDNPLLVTTVTKMLEVRESSRPDFINIKGAIPTYSEILEYFERGEDEYYDQDFTDPHHGNDNFDQYNQGYDNNSQPDFSNGN